MATYLDGYLSKLELFRNGIDDSVESKVLEHESEIREMIKRRWKLGKRPNGDLIGYYRDIDYAIFKQTINPSAGGDVDLILTGSLSNKIKLVLSGKGIEVISTDDKFDAISDKYGLDNFNVTEDEEKQILDEVMSEVLTEFFNNI